MSDRAWFILIGAIGAVGIAGWVLAIIGVVLSG